VSWLNALRRNPDRVRRFELRTSGVFRWVMVVICFGAVVGFTVAMVTGIRDDLALARNGVPVTASVYEIDKAPDKREADQYLVTYIFDGQWQAQWVEGLHNRVNDRVTIIVDRTDPRLVASRPVDGSNWIVHVIQLAAIVFFGWVVYRLIRLDVAGFRP
jgi:hypothetical protein